MSNRLIKKVWFIYTLDSLAEHFFDNYGRMNIVIRTKNRNLALEMNNIMQGILRLEYTNKYILIYNKNQTLKKIYKLQKEYGCNVNKIMFQKIKEHLEAEE